MLGKERRGGERGNKQEHKARGAMGPRLAPHNCPSVNERRYKCQTAAYDYKKSTHRAEGVKPVFSRPAIICAVSILCGLFLDYCKRADGAAVAFFYIERHTIEHKFLGDLL